MVFRFCLLRSFCIFGFFSVANISCILERVRGFQLGPCPVSTNRTSPYIHACLPKLVTTPDGSLRSHPRLTASSMADRSGEVEWEWTAKFLRVVLSSMLHLCDPCISFHLRCKPHLHTNASQSQRWPENPTFSRGVQRGTGGMIHASFSSFLCMFCSSITLLSFPDPYLQHFHYVCWIIMR